MLAQTRRVARSQKLRSAQFNTRVKTPIHTKSANVNRLDYKVPLAAIAGSATAAALVFSFVEPSVISNDAPPGEGVRNANAKAPEPDPVIWDDEHLLSLAWGSNREGLLLPSQQEIVTLRSPASLPWLTDIALRDLALHERHGVCADARGDVYQWDAKSKGPVLTLAGKNIVSVQASPSRVFALSSSGNIYALPSDSQAISGRDQIAGSSWNPFSWRTNEVNRDCVELSAAQKLGRGEKFISISAGNDHLLALTSSGRTFAHPMSKSANAHGQLGLRKIFLPVIQSPSSTDRVTVELVPKAVADPLAKASLKSRMSLQVTEQAEEESGPPELDRTDIHFCDRLFEIPSLKGIKIVQAVAGARSSFVQTDVEGRVLAWGANEYGQLGLGSTLTIDTITIPTEVVFSRSAPAGTRSRCIDITTGGDLTFFTVERTDGSSMPSADLLGCGMGQWGGLGNGMYTTAQGNPSRVKAVSGLLEFSEKTQNLQPIVPYALSVSPTGHALLTLDTLARAGPGIAAGGGRDLLVWGANRDYQLGNGKRASLATPTSLELPGLPGGGSSPVSKVGDSEGNDKKGRMMLVQRRAKEVKDLQGCHWKTNIDVEQCAIAGWGSSLVYWKIIRRN